MDQRYKSYKNALNILDLESLNDRRKYLCEKWTFVKNKTLKRNETLMKNEAVNWKIRVNFCADSVVWCCKSGSALYRHNKLSLSLSNLTHGDYFIHIYAIYVPNVAFISPISVPYIIRIRVIFQLVEFGKKLKNSDPPPPPQSKLVYI